MMYKMNLEDLSVYEVLKIWSRCLEVLNAHGYRNNNAVGDHTEKIITKVLNLNLLSVEGYDAIDSEGRRYQIKRAPNEGTEWIPASERFEGSEKGSV